MDNAGIIVAIGKKSVSLKNNGPAAEIKTLFSQHPASKSGTENKNIDLIEFAETLFMKRVLSILAVISSLFVAPVQAATVTFNYGSSFGQTAPDGPAPYATSVFDDGGGSGTVILTMTASSSIGAADITQMYFNFDPTLDLVNLEFTYEAGLSDGPAAAGGGGNGVFTGTDAFQADGDGKYDILFDFPPPPGNTKWMAGETVVYTITSTDAITASSFNYLSAPGGNAAGPFLSVARFQSTGDGSDSDWVGAGVIPIPAAVWLFGSGLLGLIGIARRKAT